MTYFSSMRISYLAEMVVLKTHIIKELEHEFRFVDYVIGVFEGFETRNAVKTGIKKNRFRINGEKAETGFWMREGDCIELMERSEKPKAYNKEIEIVYEDDFFAIVNKPAGLVVSGNQFKTLENCLVDQIQGSTASDALEWALPVHRLDAPTSGLVIFAKTITARRLLGSMFEEKVIAKQYHAIVHGIPKDGTIQSSIDGKEAISTLKALHSAPSLKNDHLTLVQLEPKSGRTHQLRIHCQSIGNSIVGDQKYGDEQGTFRNKGLFLVATQLKFNHPISGQAISVEIPIPHKFESLLNRETKRASRYL